MLEFLVANEAAMRMGAFVTILAAMGAWESIAPKRPATLSRRARWPANFGIVAVDTALVRLVFPTAVVGVALYVETSGFGLFNQFAVPLWLAFAASIIALDLAVYAQHVMFHHVPALWRLHRIHHIDLDFDVTTGIRFHPIEILISVGIKMAVVAALGAPAAAVIVFEIALNGFSMFNHGNVRMSSGLDRVVRMLVVTPDMHRVHHSAIREETDSNFGFCLSVWDRLFRTYRSQPRLGHDGMTIGQPYFRDPAESGFWSLLTNPFRSPA